jgi:adenylate kinase
VGSHHASSPSLNLVMLGPPGAGKGTQAERISRTRQLPKISTGDILREAVHDRTPLGCAAKEEMEAGHLVSDDVMIGIVQERLERADARKGFVLDGFPRTIVQANALDRLVNGRGPLVVLDIVVPEEVLVRRLASRRICSECGSNAAVEWLMSCGKCGGKLVARVDDGVEIVRERLGVYHRQTKPLVEYYSGRSTFRQIDGNLPPDVVAGAIDAALADAAERGVHL